MKYRITTWLIILLISWIPSYIKVFEAKHVGLIKLTGVPIIVSQNSTECISRMGIYWWKSVGFCEFSQYSKYILIGSPSVQLIDILIGRIWLSVRTIDVVFEEDKKRVDAVAKFGYFERIRENLGFAFDRNLPYREAALVKGMVLGDKKGFDRQYYQKIIRSGLSHIVVASGYNIALVGGIVLGSLIYILGRRVAILVTFGVISIYALVTGGEPPVMRAVFMFVFVQLGALLGRPQKGLFSLFVACVLMLLFDRYMLFELSFQLTVAATWGLMVIEPWILKRIKYFGDRLLYFVSLLGVSTSLAGSLATAPFLYFTLGKISFVGILSNTLIGLFVPIITTLGFLMLLFPQWLSLPIYGLTHWLVLVIDFFGR